MPFEAKLQSSTSASIDKKEVHKWSPYNCIGAYLAEENFGVHKQHEVHYSPRDPWVRVAGV